MHSKLRPHLTYANVFATLALFVALGGSSYAALKITGRDVRNNSLTGRDVRSLTSKDVKDGSLLARDIASEQLPASTMTVRTSNPYHGDPGGETTNPAVVVMPNFARCDPGERATGGGVRAPGGQGIEDAEVVSSNPLSTSGVPIGWEGTASYTRTEGAESLAPQVWVVCASP